MLATIKWWLAGVKLGVDYGARCEAEYGLTYTFLVYLLKQPQDSGLPLVINRDDLVWNSLPHTHLTITLLSCFLSEANLK